MDAVFEMDARIKEPRDLSLEPARHFDTRDDSKRAYKHNAPAVGQQEYASDSWYFVDIGAFAADAAFRASMESFTEDWDAPGMEAYDEL